MLQDIALIHINFNMLRTNQPILRSSLYHYMDRLIANSTKKAKINIQHVPFKNKEGFFGLQPARDTITRGSQGIFLYLIFID